LEHYFALPIEPSQLLSNQGVFNVLFMYFIFVLKAVDADDLQHHCSITLSISQVQLNSCSLRYLLASAAITTTADNNFVKQPI